MSKLLENMIPEGAKKFEKKTEEVPNASKKGPGELPWPKIRLAKEMVSKRGPGTPEAPQRPPRTEKYQISLVKLMVLKKNIKFLK